MVVLCIIDDALTHVVTDVVIIMPIIHEHKSNQDREWEGVIIIDDFMLFVVSVVLFYNSSKMRVLL